MQHENSGSRRIESIRIRRIPMAFPKVDDPVIVPGLPEESFLYIGLSLLLPYLEPYLIRSMQKAKLKIDDKDLLAEIDLFNGQEAQHYRMHVQFNKSIGVDKFLPLVDLEAELEADYGRFSESCSLRFNLAYAEGFEAFTMALTRFIFGVAAYERLKPESRELFQWHLVEELEHRTVAFDVYNRVYGDYFYRIFISLFAQWHLCRFMLRVMGIMMFYEREKFVKKFGGLAYSLRRMMPLILQGMGYFLPKLINSYMPWYSPHKISMPESVQQLADEYTTKAL